VKGEIIIIIIIIIIIGKGNSKVEETT